MGLRKYGEGGEGRRPVVCPPGQRIRLPISCAPPVDDVVVVGRKGGRIRLHCEWQIRLEVQQDGRRCEGEQELPERCCCCF